MICGTFAVAGTIAFTCNPTSTDNPDTYAAGTCDYLQNTVAAYYSSAFTNANANIFIQMGITGLGQSVTADTEITYSQYVNALTANALASKNPVQISALASLTNDTSPYGSGNVNITTALAAALGVGSGTVGVTPGGSSCFTLGSGNCYDGIVTITTPANLSAETGGTQGLYWDQAGGTIPGNDYDFYAVVQHEVDEVLGTSSCVGTGGANLFDFCSGTNTPSAVDLFRYSAADTLSLISTAVGHPDGGAAYFSYDGGFTNGASGFTYNSTANHHDYADFISSCPGPPYSIQDAQGCYGTLQGGSILNDGLAEVHILNAIGYDQPTIPEPGTVFLLGGGVAALLVIRRLRTV